MGDALQRAAGWPPFCWWGLVCGDGVFYVVGAGADY